MSKVLHLFSVTLSLTNMLNGIKLTFVQYSFVKTKNDIWKTNPMVHRIKLGNVLYVVQSSVPQINEKE